MANWSLSGNSSASNIASFPNHSEASIGRVVTSTRFDDGAASSGFNFVGAIDDVALYNQAFTAKQALTHFNATLGES